MPRPEAVRPDRARTEALGTDPAPTLEVVRGTAPLDHLPLGALVRVARRHNPKRAPLLVSRVLGKHLDVAPSLAVLAGHALGEQAAAVLTGGPAEARPGPLAAALAHALTGGALPALLPAAQAGPPAIVLGYAETATALGHLVRRSLGPGPTVHTTRWPVGGAPLVSFAEVHSHAVDHQVFHRDPSVFHSGLPVVLVDDELTTGRTAASTITALHALAPRPSYVIATLLDLRTTADRAELAALADRLGTRIDVAALASGEVTSTSVPEVVRAVPPAAALRDGDPHGPAGAPGPSEDPVTVVRIGAPPTARLGWTEAEQRSVEDAAVGAAAELQALRSGPATLVLGTEELMFAPMLLAAHLDGEVSFRSTTRSPILTSPDPGYPISDGCSYDAVDGTGGLRFLYNLDAVRYDDVLVCCEAAGTYRASPLLGALRRRGAHVHLVEVRA